MLEELESLVVSALLGVLLIVLAAFLARRAMQKASEEARKKQGPNTKGEAECRGASSSSDPS